MKNQFSIDPNTHLLQGVKFVESPNADERPDNMQIDLVVIHGISLPPGKFGGKGVEALFTNQLNPDEDPYYSTICHLKVSAHLFITREGDVVQFVPFNKRAWHAGESHWQGRNRCNDFSVGIELEGTDTQPYTEAQYAVLGEVLNALYKTYPSLNRTSISGHSDIAPGRKTDPGPHFCWDTVLNA